MSRPGPAADRPARFLDYPRGRVYAVADDRAVAELAVAALAAAGFGQASIRSGAGDADAIDGSGERHGRLARLVRLVQFSLMDQMPDLVWYEAALREGRLVVEVRAAGIDAAQRAAAALQGAGAHFINHFGRFQTAEFTRWRGPEPRVPGVLKR